jgi:hypothetical protein
MGEFVLLFDWFSEREQGFRELLQGFRELLTMPRTLIDR